MTRHPYPVAVFSAKSYDESTLSPIFSAAGIEATFIAAPLTAATAAAASGFACVCVFVNDEINADTLTQLGNCGVKHVALRCAGYNNVDLVAAADAGILVSRVPAYAPEAVAEHAVAMMMTLNRRLHKAYNRVREGNFELGGLQGFTMKGKTVGIVGTGNIGTAAARILTGFGCHLLCCDPSPNDSLVEAGAEYVSLQSLFSQSDIITLHCPLNDSSYHIINEASLTLMKPGVMLINTSRGGLIDTAAVISALKSRKLGYLGLDVYEMESELFFKDRSLDIINDDLFERLQTFPNVLITGHQGFFTNEALTQIASTTCRNICAARDNNLPAGHFIRPER